MNNILSYFLCPIQYFTWWLYFLLQELVVSDVFVTKEFAQNEDSCDLQDNSTPGPLTDRKMHAEIDESSGRPESKPKDILNHHVCEHCGKEFRKKSVWIIHVRTHTGERPYSCDQCEYKSARKSHLTLHIRTHTGEKPFSCSVCGKSFAQSATLKRHHLSHTGDKQHKCDLCGKMFGRKGNLTQHLRTHTGDKPYGCDMCGKMFRQSSARTKHVKRCSNASKP